LFAASGFGPVVFANIAVGRFLFAIAVVFSYLGGACCVLPAVAASVHRKAVIKDAVKTLRGANARRVSRSVPPLPAAISTQWACWQR